MTSRPTPQQRALRIALVTQGYATGGGVPTVARWLYAGLSDLGHSVTVHDLATSKSDPLSTRVLKPGSWRRSSLRRLGDDGVHRWGAELVEWEPFRYSPRRELTEELNTYDIIQVVAGTPALGCVARDCDVPTVLQVATRAEWERVAVRSRQSLPTRLAHSFQDHRVARLEVEAVQGASVVLVENPAMLAFCRDLGQPMSLQAPPGVDTDVFFPSRDGWHKRGSITCVARYGDPRKGLERSVYAYSILCDRMPDAPPLTVIGRGTPQESLTEIIKDRDLGSRVNLVENASREELVRALQRSSLILLASHEEGLGLTLLEGMACGLPAVATRTEGSAVSVEDGVVGYLIEQTDEGEVVEQLAHKMYRVLSETGAEMSLAARELVVTGFSNKISLGRFIDAYVWALDDARNKSD